MNTKLNNRHGSDGLALSRRQALAGLGCALAAGALGGAAAAWADEAGDAAGAGASKDASKDASTEAGQAAEVAISFSDEGIEVDGKAISEDISSAVYLAHDVVYYEDRDEYDSGNPYGEGTDAERHSAEDAAAVSVVHIAQAGTYRLTGSVSAGQMWVDLGEDADKDPQAKVTLVLDDLDITCKVAPAIVFHRVYECDGGWSADTATATVDTSEAGAVLLIADGSVNNVCGSHVARIYKDNDEQKKLWKIDGALYSFMSMNVEGGPDSTGVLNITADNEGLDSELHLTVNGGNVSIVSQDDGINTNEDGVSVTAVNGGTLHIVAGLGSEGDGIDSNGFLVINGGTVIAMANPASDSGLDSDMGSYVNGGTVVALGSTMDWAESDSDQVTMNLQFAASQDAGDAIVVCDADGQVVFAYDPSEDETAAGNTRNYTGAVLSCANFEVGQTYSVYVGGTVSGQEVQGVYDVETVTGYEGGAQQAYTGTDVRQGPGGFGGGAPAGGPGNRPGGGQEPPERGEGVQDASATGQVPPEMPDGEAPTDGGKPGEGDAAKGQEPPVKPDGEAPADGGPQGQGGGQPPTPPEGEAAGEMRVDESDQPAANDAAARSGESTGNAQDAADSTDLEQSTQASTDFYMQDKVNAFSGVSAAE